MFTIRVFVFLHTIHTNISVIFANLYDFWRKTVYFNLKINAAKSPHRFHWRSTWWIIIINAGECILYFQFPVKCNTFAIIMFILHRIIINKTYVVLCLVCGCTISGIRYQIAYQRTSTSYWIGIRCRVTANNNNIIKFYQKQYPMGLKMFWECKYCN